jgi:hypothetical protein
VQRRQSWQVELSQHFILPGVNDFGNISENMEKKMAFRHKIQQCILKNNDNDRFFKKIGHLFPGNWSKSQKIVFILLTPEETEHF